MAIRVCPLCQAEFLEFKNTCTQGGVALVDPAEDVDGRLLEEDEQVVYDLSAWPIDAQTETSMVFAESSLPHQWDGTDLIVPAVHEESADRLLERVEDQFGLVSDEELERLAEAEAELRDPESIEDTSGGETEYDLIGGETSRRAELVSRLVEVGIAHRWEDDMLIVPTPRDGEVDEILDDMEGVAPGERATASLEPAEIASTLVLVADRMRKGQVDAERYGRLCEVLEVAEPAKIPYGWDPAVWQEALELGEDLADAVADDTDEIESVATSLYDVLRPLI
ncbi:MAG: hypothetical protein ACKOD2_02125 [Ilumatobacteraceae bacterium]